MIGCVLLLLVLAVCGCGVYTLLRAGLNCPHTVSLLLTGAVMLAGVLLAARLLQLL